MKVTPHNVRYEPILCPTCLPSRRAQQMWLDRKDLTLVCPVHDTVMTCQMVEALTGEGLGWK